jgi:heme/copper-type cytochrome/quinol oxidase subunit 2
VSPSLRYGTAAVLLIGVVTLGLSPFVGETVRTGVLVAGLIALPTQVLAFSLLVKYRGRANGFMAAWAGGMALRTAVVVIAAVVVIRSGSPSAVPMLLALAGFFFGLLVLEGFYFRAAPTPTSVQTAGRAA